MGEHDHHAHHGAHEKHAKHEPRAHEPPAAPPPPGTVYVCPMHPEIRRDRPGSCSKCGMALEPEMPTLGDEESPELVDFRARHPARRGSALPVHRVAALPDGAALAMSLSSASVVANALRLRTQRP